MITFTESFYSSAFYYKDKVEAFREYILDIINTEKGTRPYYPDYGLLLESFKYSILTLSLAQRIHSEVYFVLSSIEGVRIVSTNYKMNHKERKLELYYDLVLGQEPIGLHLSYNNGAFS